MRWASPAWAWLYLGIIYGTLWIPYDLWAIKHKHNTLTRQMHDWIFSPAIGPFIIAGFAFVFVLLLMHFTRYHAR